MADATQVIDDPMETNENEKSENKKPGKSKVWNHFKLLERKKGQVRRAECKYCHKVYQCDSKKHGTSSLTFHVNHSCTKFPGRNVNKSQQLLSFEKKPEGDLGLSNVVIHKFNQETSRLTLAEMVIMDELSFRAVEAHGFKRFCRTLEPKFQVPSRTTVARDCIKLYQNERDKLQKILGSSANRFSFTTDTWTSIQNLNYMCLIAHFIDDNWKLNKRIINFCLIPNHRGDTIGKQLEACLLAWGIDRICTITVDNASSNDVAIDYLRRHMKGNILGGESLHMRCCAHILNLVVSEGLKEHNDSIIRVRNVVRYVRSSPARMEKFKRCVDKERIDCKTLVCLDVSTRWNSTYLMLEAAQKYQKAFERLEDDDGQYVSYFSEGTLGSPRSFDWENVRVLVKFLKIFYDSTLRISGSLYVTCNLLFQELCIVQTSLSKLCENRDPFLSVMAMSMKKKYDKYWGNIEKMNLLIFVAVLLDPRCKLGALSFWFKQNFDANSNEAEEMLTKVKNVFQRLYDEYALVFGNCSEVQSRNASNPPLCDPGSSSVSVVDTSQAFWHIYAQFESSSAQLETKSEVDQYLSDGCEAKNPEFDILNWWKLNSAKYPILSHVAKDVLAIPISTVASESAFSTGGRVLDPFRSSLSPKTVEAIVCAQNWLKDLNPFDDRNAMDYMEIIELDSRNINIVLFFQLVIILYYRMLVL